MTNERLPERIGPWKIVQVLGRGGMGVVYRAVHVETGQPAAIKTVIVPKEDLFASIRREIHALANLSHPGVVHVLDEGVDGGLPWYAMELVEGATLREWCAEHSKNRDFFRPAWEVRTRRSSGSGDDEVVEEVSGWWTDVIGSQHAEPEPAAETAGQELGPTSAGEKAEPIRVETEASRSEGERKPPAENPLAGLSEHTIRRVVSQIFPNETGEEAPIDPKSEPAPAKPSTPRTPAAKPEAAAGGLQPVLTSVRKLCSTLAFLHGEGIVHRDLKPENVLVRKDGSPILVDFGITTRVAGDRRETLEVEDDVVLGTPLYMAPEQVLRDVLDARADLYALGGILYELVTGRPPFLAAEAVDVLRAHLHTSPIPPSAFVAGVPPALEALILRLLEKRPRDRFGHAADIAAVLAELGAENGFASDVRPRPYLYRPDFAGRDDVLAKIDGLLARLDRREGGVLFIGGESGVGKTRLANELGRRAERKNVRVLTGECRRVGAQPSGGGGGGPLHAFRQLFLSIADRCRDRGAGETKRLLSERAKILSVYAPELGRVPGASSYPDPVDLPPSAARRRVFLALAETLGALGVDEPFVLVLDDLQWADELTLGFLGHALRTHSFEEWRVLVVGTYRSEETTPALRSLFELAGGDKIELGRLDESAVASIVGDMLALFPPPEGFVRLVANRAEGNPFFVAEYLRAAIAEGILWRDEKGRWQAPSVGRGDETAAALENIGLPGSLKELVVKRLDVLSPGARFLAEVASVLGRETEWTLLATVAQESGPAGEPLEPLSELIARQVLEETEPGRLRFVHDKIREFAYERLDEAHRRSLHKTTAEVLERLGSDERRGLLAEIADHWERAGVDERARRSYLAAARAATSTYVLGEAERLYRAYLRLALPNPEAVVARNELARDVLSVAGRNQEAINEHSLALDIARSVDDPPGVVASLQGLSTTHRLTGALEVARRTGEEALSLARNVGDRRQEGATLTILAAAHVARGSLQDGKRLFEEALAIHRQLGNRKLEAITLSNIAVIYRLQGWIGDARTLQREALAIHREVGNRRSEGITLDNLGTLEFDEGDPGTARTFHEEALSILRAVGDRRFEATTLANLGLVSAADGFVDEAEHYSDQALSILREIGDRPAEAEALIGRAWLARVARGDLAGASTMEEIAETLFRSLGNALLTAECLVERGHLALAEGRSAQTELDEARTLSADADLGPGSPLGWKLDRLTRSEAVFLAGQKLPRGTRTEDIPEGLRRTIGESAPGSRRS